MSTTNSTCNTCLSPARVPQMKPEIRYFCLYCLGVEFYMATLDLRDGTEAWIHMCIECNIRMEYAGTDHL